MRSLRSTLLSGEKSDVCTACYYEDSHNKVSGRQRQLLKSTVDINNFDKTLSASPHWKLFEYSHDNQGQTDYQPVDIQIDIGNVCNSACIMCNPIYSSRLAQDYKKLSLVEPGLFKITDQYENWTDNESLVDKFINELEQIPNLKYLHFLGGETLYLKSFYTICNRLIANGLSQRIIIGLTTNCTVYSEELEHIIKNFKQVHLGLSIETVTNLNDYIRWPSKIDQVQTNIDNFIKLKDETNLHLSLRITPTVLSIYHIDSIFRFMLDQRIMAESCNILQEPTVMRIELLPNDLRQEIIDKIDRVIDDYNLVESGEVIVNRRRDDLIDPVITSVIFEYRNFLASYDNPLDVELERHNLVKFIKGFESLRNNTILSYLPEYEEFLRSYDY